jgi:mercuric reductase
VGSGFDLAILGSGAAGFAAAIAVRRLGHSVIMIGQGQVGGTCVNTGCVPSKALLAAAEAGRAARSADRFPGMHGETGLVDFTALIDGKERLVEQMRADKYIDLATSYGWEILSGTARFASGPTLHIVGPDGARTVNAQHYLIATGSTPDVPAIPGLAEAGFLTSTTAMELTDLPASLLVIGGNAVGLEQAQLFARLGTRVTVVEALDRLAPFDEPEASACLADAFAEEGIAVRVGCEVTAVHRAGDRATGNPTGNTAHGVTATLRASDGREVQLTASRVLVATGRRPATDELGLDMVGVKVGDRGEVVVDAHLRTDNPRIWAAGDVVGGPQYVYVAAAHGSTVAANALGGADRTVDYRALPRVTFTSPAIASAGLTEAQAQADGFDCDCRVLPLANVPRAVINRDTRGVVKLVADRATGQLLGVTAVADAAGEVIAAASYALTAGMTVTQLAAAWCPYLTMAEALKLAAQAFTQDVTRLSCCAA